MPQLLLCKVFMQTCAREEAGVPGSLWPSWIWTRVGKGWRGWREKGRNTNHPLGKYACGGGLMGSGGGVGQLHEAVFKFLGNSPRGSSFS